jgi:cob(I)alamin adenosyltransferase
VIIVNTGGGKGKTTSAVGQIIRALGHKKRVCLIQLFKPREFYGEQYILQGLDGLDFFAFAKNHPACCDVDSGEVRLAVKAALEKIKLIAASPQKYDLIVLDEFNIALRDKFLDELEFLELVKELSLKSDIVITGRQAPQSLIDAADLVSEMKEIKHPYNEGVKLRCGIEF